MSPGQRFQLSSPHRAQACARQELVGMQPATPRHFADARLRIKGLSDNPSLVRVAPPPPALNCDDLSYGRAPRSPPIAPSRTSLFLARCSSPSGYIAANGDCSARSVWDSRVATTDQSSVKLFRPVWRTWMPNPITSSSLKIWDLRPPVVADLTKRSVSFTRIVLLSHLNYRS